AGGVPAAAGHADVGCGSEGPSAGGGGDGAVRAAGAAGRPAGSPLLDQRATARELSLRLRDRERGGGAGGDGLHAARVLGSGDQQDDRRARLDGRDHARRIGPGRRADVKSTRAPREASLTLAPSRNRAYDPATLSRFTSFLRVAGLWQYAVPLLAVLVAALTRVAIEPLWGARLPFFTFYPAVMLSAWCCGFRAGLLATLGSVVVIDYLWLGEVFDLGGSREVGEIAALGLFTLVGL